MITVKRSPIHGKGVFAAGQIRKGTWVGTYEGKATKRNGMHVLWIEPNPGSGSWEGINGTGELRYLNHSTRPNCEFDGAELYALKQIRRGAELTFDYGEDPS